MVEQSELGWIAQKAAELLIDKVRDAPLTDRDIELAFEMFAKPRLERLSGFLQSELERRQAKDFIMMKLQERAKQLNAEHWQKT
jgi:AAA+ ATPase superfamily predicted ATPase